MNSKITILLTLVLTLACKSPVLIAATSSVNVALSATVAEESILTATSIDIPAPRLGKNRGRSIVGSGTSVTASIRTGSASPAFLTVTASDESGSNPFATVKAKVATKRGGFFIAGPIAWNGNSYDAMVGHGLSGSYSGTFDWQLASPDSSKESRTIDITYVLISP